LSLKPFRAALGSTPVIAAGGYNAENADEGLAAGEHDLIAMGRYFCSNADLVDRIRTGKPLYRYSELLLLSE
jgi:2,4-dienoyl-CoA reductase-like NADH-dependent reductase (Old Yellow Enzyme family)